MNTDKVLVRGAPCVEAVSVLWGHRWPSIPRQP